MASFFFGDILTEEPAKQTINKQMTDINKVFEELEDIASKIKNDNVEDWAIAVAKTLQMNEGLSSS